MTQAGTHARASRDTHPSTKSANQSVTPHLGVALRQRHVTMISLGGIIGAGHARVLSGER